LCLRCVDYRGGTENANEDEEVNSIMDQATSISRRKLLAVAAAGTVIGATVESSQMALAAAPEKADKPFGYCLNMSTIRDQKLSVPEQVEVAAKAGYDAIEPWMGELHQFVELGGKPADLRKRIEDSGLTVESAIGFAEWIVDDETKRKQGLENAKRDMQLLREIGGKRIAAPPVGAIKQTDLNLLRAAERYHALLEIGRQIGVTPQLELWGFSQSLSRLGELLYVATESGHPDACLLPDVYHIYKGGSDFNGLRLINGQVIHVFHVNDYPENPPRATIGDADRVYPGDGVAPLTSILRGLRQIGFRGMLSLELFNKEYGKQDALQVARTGLDKMRESVRKSLA
jgi:2-keto-myo-inositol isomerase